MSSNAVAALGVGIAALLVIPFVNPFDMSGQPDGADKDRDGKSVLPEVPGAEAFPGAEGFGRRARGGRGGMIIPVTTLADHGPGSLRACIETKRPRICVFRVSGVIRFTTERPVIGPSLYHDRGPDGSRRRYSDCPCRWCGRLHPHCRQEYA